MSRITATFARLKAAGRTAFMPFLTIGYPEVDSALTLVPAMLEAGADMVELGVPFSDPIADGPTIQRSSFRALQNGVTLEKCFQTASALRSKTDAPLLFMGYYNPIFSYGLERYTARCAEVGIDGLIIPDLPVEEAGPARDACRRAGLDLPAFVTPTSTDERIALAARSASGFIYCIALAGVTGARSELPAYLPDFLNRVRSRTDLPLVLGFGISRPDHFAAVRPLVDGAIIASALIDALDQAPEDQKVERAAAFVRSITSQ